MTAAVLATGTELTRGELVNSNAAHLAGALTALGFEVTEIVAVDDDRPRIAQTVARLASVHDVIVGSGGLGPTTDDLTREAVADVLGVPLERDEASLAHIRERFARAGRKLAASNEKQADFPRGARVVPNPRGTAPGFAVTIGRARAFFLPGVPSELEAMFRDGVAPELAALVVGGTHQVLLRTFGLPESEVNDRLAGIEATFGVTLGYRARLPEIFVKVLARAETPADARARSEAAAAEVRKRLGDAVYAEGETTLAEAVRELLEARGLTLSLAESCTGGLIAELVTAREGASRSFAGGVVAYANAAKTELLGVDAALIAQHGAVSAEVARAMAEGARQRFGSSLAASVTGIAGPSGGTPEKPVGLVYFAVASEAATIVKERVFPGERRQIQLRSAYAVLALVRRVLLGTGG